MNPYQMRVTCAVCGGEGMAIPGRGHPWVDRFTHNDPEVCRSYLAQQRRKLDRIKTQLTVALI